MATVIVIFSPQHQTDGYPRVETVRGFFETEEEALAYAKISAECRKRRHQFAQFTSMTENADR